MCIYIIVYHIARNFHMEKLLKFIPLNVLLCCKGSRVGQNLGPLKFLAYDSNFLSALLNRDTHVTIDPLQLRNEIGSFCLSLYMEPPLPLLVRPSWCTYVPSPYLWPLVLLAFGEYCFPSLC